MLYYLILSIMIESISCSLLLKNMTVITFYFIQLHVCESILESEGVLGHVTFDEFPLELFPLDTDLLSLEFPEFFTSFYLVSFFFIICV